MSEPIRLRYGAALVGAAMLGAVAMGGSILLISSIASAGPSAAKVTICHRTASQTNPYVKITVAQDAVDGDLANDNGQGDHFREHLGAVGPHEAGEWGDIIPPIAGVHGGLNWGPVGQAIFNRFCGDAEPTTTVQGDPEPTTTVKVTTTKHPTTTMQGDPEPTTTVKACPTTTVKYPHKS